MKKAFCILFAAAAAMLFAACGNDAKIPEYPYPTVHGQMTYFQEKDGLYSTFEISKKDIVLVGDDLFDRGMWSAFYGSDRVKNRGIALEGTECTRYRIGKIAAGKPEKIFISTGLFDIKKGILVSTIRSRILEIVNTALMVSPESEVYVVGLVPDGACRRAALRDSVEAVNDYLASVLGDKFLNLAGAMCDSTGYMNSWFLVGDNRINGAGYEVIAKFLSPYVGLKSYNSIFNDPVMSTGEFASAVSGAAGAAGGSASASDASVSRMEKYSSWYASTYQGRSAHYIARLSIFYTIPNTLGKTVMLGNSITNNCWWDELLDLSYSDVVNRGISGDMTSGILARLSDINDENPTRVFIMTGVNDFIENPSASVSEVWENYKKILSSLRSAHPRMKIYAQSTLPMNPKSPYCAGRNAKVRELDSLLAASCALYGYEYVDLLSSFMDADGNLDESLTADGIHLLPRAYEIWKEKLKDIL